MASSAPVFYSQITLASQSQQALVYGPAAAPPIRTQSHAQDSSNSCNYPSNYTPSPNASYWAIKQDQIKQRIIKASSKRAQQYSNQYQQQQPSSTDSLVKPIGNRTVVRAAGGELWNDPTLLEWDKNDYRLFCGDLGSEVNDDMLKAAFHTKYTSFVKAKVVRDKKTGKSRGYGFVSFKDPNDFTRALKEMQGKYIGHRPVKLVKSNWEERNVDVTKRNHK